MSPTLLAPRPEASPPSRGDNPFATCWTRPGAIGWVDVGGDALRGAVTGLPACAVACLNCNAGWQVVGPHGSGKSALLHALADTLRTRGCACETLMAGAALERDLWDPEVTHFVEGFERLGRRDRRRCFDKWRRQRTAFVITTHRRLRRWRGSPKVLAELRPNRRLLATLFDHLTRERPTTVSLGNALASFARRRGNLREVWFDLYELHEGRRRSLASLEPANDANRRESQRESLALHSR